MARTKTKLDDDRLIAEHVDASWGRSRARLRSGVPIWSLIGYLRVYDGDAERVRQAFDLSADEMAAALAYYQQNQQYAPSPRRVCEAACEAHRFQPFCIHSGRKSNLEQAGGRGS